MQDSGEVMGKSQGMTQRKAALPTVTSKASTPTPVIPVKPTNTAKAAAANDGTNKILLTIGVGIAAGALLLFARSMGHF